MSVCIIKKSHPLYDFWRWFYTRDYIAAGEETVEGVKMDAERIRPGRTQPIIKRRTAPVGMKYCSRCKELLPLECFRRDRKNGHQRYCNKCSNKAATEYRQRKAQAAREKKAQEPPKPKPTALRCYKCVQTKPISEFYQSSGTYRYICRDCDKARRRELHRKTKEKMLAMTTAREAAKSYEEITKLIILERHTNEEIMIIPSLGLEEYKKELYYGDDDSRAE